MNFFIIYLILILIILCYYLLPSLIYNELKNLTYIVFSVWYKEKAFENLAYIRTILSKDDGKKVKESEVHIYFYILKIFFLFYINIFLIFSD